MSATIVLLLIVASQARAQLPHFDPLPFRADADSSSSLSLTVEMGHFWDQRYAWETNRLLVTTTIPAGERARLFVRLPYLDFDTGEVSVPSRWPWVVGEDADSDWPGEQGVAGFGQLEAGLIGALDLPFAGSAEFAIAAGVPVGDDRLYPLSAAGLPLRIALRDGFAPGPHLRLGIEAEYLTHLDSSGDEIRAFGFPSGSAWRSFLDWYLIPGGCLGFDYQRANRDGRRSQLLAVQLWLPWASSGAVGVRAARELQGSLDRPADWYVSLAWRLDSLAHRPGRGGSQSAH